MRFLCISLFLTMTGLQGFCQDHKVEVVIKGLKNTSGKLQIGFFDEEGKFRKKESPAFSQSLPLSDTIVQADFAKIPQGRYALAVYHDENNDDQLNTKKLGVPAEGVGFSGILKSKVKPPRFDEASFYLKSDTTLIIRMRYPEGTEE
jgi:uncharacterized protein (DUF2141 family)